MKVSISYLKSKEDSLTTIKKINETTGDYLHVDLMDGLFCGENNYQKDEVLALLNESNKKLDIHLMMKNPLNTIVDLSILRPMRVTIPCEIDNVKDCLLLLDRLGIQKGLAINPETDISKLSPYFNEIDSILVMSVHPGKGGQTFIETTSEKLKNIRKLFHKEISVDGGINDHTIKMVSQYVDEVVAGSYVCLSDNYEKMVKKLKDN